MHRNIVGPKKLRHRPADWDVIPWLYCTGMIPFGTDQMSIGIRRREFISVIGGAAVAWPHAARAQQPEPMRRIGVLMNWTANDLEGFIAAQFLGMLAAVVLGRWFWSP